MGYPEVSMGKMPYDKKNQLARGILCEEDQRQKEIQRHVQDFIEGIKTYQELIDSLPDYRESMIKKFISLIRRNKAA